MENKTKGVRINNGNLDNINVPFFIKLAKSKAKPIIAGTLAIGTTVLLWNNAHKKREIVIPEGSMSYVAEYEVRNGDTLEEIVQNYYGIEEKEAYGNFKNFESSVKEASDLNKPLTNLAEGDVVKVPCVIETDNPLYIEIQNIQNELNNIIKTDYWTLYTTKPGDTLENIALMACDSDYNYTEARSIVNEIKSKNGLDYILPSNTQIAIVNPKIGELKRALKSATEELNNSLQNEEEKSKTVG